MNHVLLTGDTVGGVWRYSVDLAAGLVARGIEATLAVLGPPPSPAQHNEADSRAVRVVATGLPLDWTARDEPALRATVEALAGLASRRAVDCVHLHSPALVGGGDWPTPVVAVAHSDVGTWWSAVRGGALPPDLVWRAAATARGLATAEALIAPSHSFAASLRRCYGCTRRIDVVHNGCAARTVAGGARVGGVLAAGRLWDAGKNVALLDCVAGHFGIAIDAAGPLAGPDGSSVSFPHLRCLGVLDAAALAKTMRRRSVFISSARYEPFGLAVLEAARSGMALALSDIPTYRELWDGAALFFDPDDDVGAARCCHVLLADPAAMAARAGDRARQYSLDAMVEKTLAVQNAAVAARADMSCAS